MNKHMRKFILVALVFAGGACTNPEVPAGHEGYVYQVPLMFGKMEYRESLSGPSSTGMSWRLYVDNIDMRERNYPEQFDLLTADDLKVAFEVNTRVRLRRGSVKEIVEQWGGEHWYEWNVKEPLRTIVRRQLMKVSAADIQLETTAVAKKIELEAIEKYKSTPIEILSVDIGHFEFPKEVTMAIQEKIAKQQELERQQYIFAKTEKEAAIRVLEALKVARQQRIISSTLDPLFVQRKAVQVYRSLAESPNKTVIMLPNSPEGTGLPLVLTEGKRKIVSADDEKLLEAMERKYIDKLPATDAESPLAPAVAPEGAAPVAPTPAAPAPAPTAPTPAAP